MDITDPGPLSDKERLELGAAVHRLHVLEELVRWGFSQAPPFDVKNVVVQDEYSHDVVLSWKNDRYLVFDTT